MGIAFTGLMTDFNTDSIVAQLMSIERIPVTRQERKRAEQVAKQNAVSDVGAALTALRTSMGPLKDLTSLTTAKVTSSNPEVLAVTNAGATGEGIYSVVVGRLATAERLVQTTGPADLESTVG